MKWVCLSVALFSSRRSTTRLGSPVFLLTTCILLHHVVGVLEGMRSMTPRAISCSNSSLTLSIQCAGMVDGLWTATGVEPSFTSNLKGGKPVMSGRGWWGHVLNADDAYVSSNQSRTLSTLLGVILNGGASGGLGGGVRSKQPHAARALPFASFLST